MKNKSIRRKLLQLKDKMNKLKDVRLYTNNK